MKSRQKTPLLLTNNLRTPLRINKQILTLHNIPLLNPPRPPINTRQNTRRREQLQRIPHGDLTPAFGDLIEGRVGDVEALGLGAQAGDGFDFVRGVVVRGDDEEAGVEVWGDAVRGGDVVCSADDGVAAVGG